MQTTKADDDVAATKASISRSRRIPEAVIAQAAADPARPAVVFDGVVLTFGQLVELAGDLAGRLRMAGVRSGTAVASCLPRGLATVTSVLGIWMAGGVYVPLDSAGPARRLAYMLSDSAAHVIITRQEGVALLPDGAEIIIVDSQGVPLGVPGAIPDPVQTSVQAEDLAYVIYTSGTTGNPKGVIVEHGSLAAMASGHERVLYPGPGDQAKRVALNASATFDVFFSDLVNLAAGRTLYVVGEATRRDPERLAQFITSNSIEVFTGTPTQIRAVLLAGRGAVLSSLRTLILSGEAIDAVLWRQLQALTSVRIYNFYGPTECTVHVTVAAISRHPTPVIGVPLPQCQAWVVDTALRPLPDGIPGEICIGGPQVARGYLHASPEDAARFAEVIPPDSAAPVRVYRTGDRGRRNESDQLEYLGRLDDQVSIDGYRVELREVELVLRHCPGVRDAAVGVRERQSAASFMAWVVLAAGTSLDDVRAWLGSMIPEYMIPRVAQVPAIPMRPSGKADVAALLGGAAPSQKSISDRSSTDLRSIWCQVLDVTSVKPSDDFFALGGNSLKATQLTVAVRAAIAPGLPIRVIFDHPRFDAFASAIASITGRVANDVGQLA